MLENDPICFIGCRLNEPGLKQLFSYCRERQWCRIQLAERQGVDPGRPPPRFILMATPSVTIDQQASNVAGSEIMHQAESSYEDMGIKVLWYGNSHANLRAAFEQIAGLPQVVPNPGWEGGGDAS